MSRHRNFRKLNYDDEREIDDVYGRSFEEEHCISPNTAAQFMYDRNAQTHSISSYLERNEIPEEEDESDEDNFPAQQLKKLNDLDEARLQSCLDEIHNIVGDSIPDSILREAILTNDFDIEKSLNAVLSRKTEPKHQQQTSSRPTFSLHQDDFKIKTQSYKNQKSYSNPILNLNLSGLISSGDMNKKETVTNPSVDLTFILPSSLSKSDERKSNPAADLMKSYSNSNSNWGGLNSSILNDILPTPSSGASLSLSDLAKQYGSPLVLKPNSTSSKQAEQMDLGLDLMNALRVKSAEEKIAEPKRKRLQEKLDLSPVRTERLSSTESDLNERPMNMANLSPFGLVVCNNLRQVKLPVFSAVCEVVGVGIKPFDFGSPSPDDEVRRKINGQA